MPVQDNIQISVIIPVFNQERFIGRCLRSILSQSMDQKDYEVIVIDDCSSDNTLSAMDRFLEDVILIKQKENKGLPTALNSGIKKAKGRFIIRLDSDDYVHFEYLNILSLFMKMNTNVDAVSCDYLEVDDKEKIIDRHSYEENPIGCGIMFRIEQLIEIGLYNEEQLWNEEREFMNRFSKKFKVFHLKFPLYRYRQHENNMTKNDEMMDKYNVKLLKNT
tara:strand:- start:4613 stop:5269 length:657 start_codon:yes stop_codon:yes gene_type:complete